MYELAPLADADREAVVSIFNYFVENSFAAYPEERVGEAFFDRIVQMAEGYPAVCVKTEDGTVAGFAFLHPYHPAKTFRRTAEVTYFLLPEHTRKGAGSAVLEYFVREAGRLGIDTLVASISSLNEESIRFHLKHGFECRGRLNAVGRKFGRDFDVIWMQKKL